MEKKHVLASVVVMMVVMVWATTATAVVYTDDFTYADGSLSAQADWQRRGDKNEWLVSTNQITPEGIATGGTSAVWYSGAVHTSELYQKVAVDLEFNANFVVGAPGWFMLSLNQDMNNSGAYTNEQGYAIQLRSGDFLVTKTTGEGIHDGGGDWQLYPTPLVAGTTYRIQLERYCDVIVGTIYDGATIIAQDRFTDTGVELTGGMAGIIGFYQDSVNDYVVDNFEFELDDGLRAIPPVIVSDSFTYPDGGLSAVSPANWLRRGDKWEWTVSSNALGSPSGDNGSWSKLSAAGAEDSYQKAGLDFTLTFQPTAYSGGWFMISLNHEWGSSGYYMNQRGYMFTVRSAQDMWIARDDDNDGVSANNWSWGGDTGAPQYDAFDTPLVAGITYRAELEKDGSVITGTVYQGTTIMGQASFDEAGSVSGPRTSGLSGIVNHYQDDNDFYLLDNYEYTSEPGLCKPGSCGDFGTVYLDGDFDLDCYVEFNDLNIIVEQWLYSSDPDSPGFAPPPPPEEPSFKLPHDNSIVVDGDLSDWPAEAEWIKLDKLYHSNGSPDDVTEARFSACWDDVDDVVYVAVDVEDTSHALSATFVCDDCQDCVEIYSQGSGAGGTGWTGEFDVAQQYRVGPSDVVDNEWAVWGTSEAIDPGVGLAYEAKISGTVITYEMAVPQFDTYEGLSGSGTTVPTQLDAGDVIGLDIVAISRQLPVLPYTTSWWAENLDSGKFDNAGQFAQYTLVEGLGCGDVGYWSADTTTDCDVNLVDYASLADDWMQCTDPNNMDCDQFWLP